MFKMADRLVLFPGYTAHNDHLPLADFKELAATAAECGFSHVDLGNALVSRSRYQLDNDGVYGEGYDFYPEYTAAFPDFFKFHCPAELSGVISADYVERNMEQLHLRSEILRALGLKGSLIGAAPQWLPEAIYQEHPAWRGPRCDMPFRSRRPYFAPCVDNDEVLALYREASDAIGKAAPVLDTAIFLCVDSGTGLCWYDRLYAGANGPGACRHRAMEERVAGFTSALSHGLSAGGRQPLVYLTNIPTWTFSGHLLPHPGVVAGEKIYFARAPQDKPVIHENPLGMLGELEKAVQGQADLLVVNVEQPKVTFRAGGLYPRLMKRFLANPTRGKTSQLFFMKKLATEMGLEDDDNHELTDAWQHLYRAIDDTSHNGRLFYNSIFLYVCMSCRTLTRPFLPLPESVSLEEKLYFHKHVFNSLDDEQSRNDLLFRHGGRTPFTGRSPDECERNITCLDSVLTSLDEAVRCLDRGIEAGVAASAYYVEMRRRVKGLRCFTVNLRNICAFQPILDRAAEGEFSKEANSSLLEGIMRREVDNTQELIDLLEASEVPLIPLAKKAEDENTFLFGPDLTAQLKTKISLMMRQWHDSQKLFANKTQQRGW